MRLVLTSIAQILGAILIVAGVAVFSLPAAVITFGALLVAAGIAQS